MTLEVGNDSIELWHASIFQIDLPEDGLLGYNALRFYDLADSS